MNKLKLQIQFFSSTNETTHYNLSQYIGSDKPTYLVDYNSDMSKIDTGIYDADAKGTQANNNIGNMSNLTTTATTDLVSAINEVDAHADTNATNISNNTTDIATNTSAIGTIANLQTTDKTNLVNAINEVKGVNDTQDTTLNNLISYLNFTNFNNDVSVTTDHGTIEDSELSYATNTNNTLAKIYGYVIVNGDDGNQYADNKVKFQSTLRPSQDITINAVGIYNRYVSSNFDNAFGIKPVDAIIRTSGQIELTCPVLSTGHQTRIVLHPCLLFIQDFGDSPINPQ